MKKVPWWYVPADQLRLFAYFFGLCLLVGGVVFGAVFMVMGGH